MPLKVWSTHALYAQKSRKREKVRNDFETIQSTEVLLIRTAAICIALVTSNYIHPFILFIYDSHT